MAQQSRVQTDSLIEPIDVHPRPVEAPNLSQGWQRPSTGDNDFQELAAALSTISPTLSTYANKQERLAQAAELTRAQMEFAKARMEGTMEPLRKAVREGKLPEGDNPWLNVFRKKLVVANEVSEQYRGHLLQQAALLSDPDATPEAIAQAYNAAKQNIQPLLDSQDPVIQGELAGRLAEANSEFESVLAKNRSSAVVTKTYEQAQMAIEGFINDSISGGTINQPLFHSQVGGLLKQAKQMGVQNPNEMLVDGVAAKAKQLAQTNPDAALSLIEATLEYSPVKGGTIGGITKYAARLNAMASQIEDQAERSVGQSIKNFREQTFDAIDNALLERGKTPGELEKIATEFEQQAKEAGFNSVRFDIRDHIAKRTGQLTKSLEWVDNSAISDVQRLAYVGDIEEAQTRLNAADNIPFDTRLALSKMIQSQQKMMDTDRLEHFKETIAQEMYAPGNIDTALFPQADAGTALDPANIIEQKQADILENVSKLRTKLVGEFAAQNNMSIIQTLNDPAAMREIDSHANSFIEQSIRDFSAKMNRRNQQQREHAQRKAEIEQSAMPWRFTEYFRSTESNLRNLDAVRLRMLSKPSTAHTAETADIKARWVEANNAANTELDRLAGTLLNGVKASSASDVTGLDNEELTRRIEEASLKTYFKLHDAIGWGLDEIRKGYSRHGLVFKDENINPLVTRIVRDTEEYRQLRGSEELIALSRRFNLPPEVLLSAQADLLGLEKIEQ